MAKASYNDKGKIEKNFSRYAHIYDKYAGIQRRSAAMLAETLPSCPYGKILEIGCGTGNYTRLLRDKFPLAKIRALDISAQMVRIAITKFEDKSIDFIIADAESLDLDERYDIITSNASMHWLRNFDETIKIYNKILNENGVIAFSAFGPGTFSELKKSLEDALGKNIGISADYLMGRDELAVILKTNFKSATLREENIKTTYSSLIELLNGIKYTGARGGVSSDFVWNKETLRKVEESYKANFGEITATYQIFFCRADR